MWPWHRRSDEDFAEEIHDHIVQETKRLIDDEGLNFVDATGQGTPVVWQSDHNSRAILRR